MKSSRAFTAIEERNWRRDHKAVADSTVASRAGTIILYANDRPFVTLRYFKKSDRNKIIERWREEIEGTITIGIIPD